MKIKALFSVLVILAVSFSTSARNAAFAKNTVPVDIPKHKLSITVLGDNYDIENVVRLFNQNKPEVEIIINKFSLRYDSFDEDYAKYKTHMMIQLMSGLGDDIIDASNLSHIKLASSGLLAGFYSLMENDKSFNKDDYYMNVFEAMSFKDELYVFPLNFTYTMIGVNNTVSDGLVSGFKQFSSVSDRDLLDMYKAEENKAGMSVYDGLSPNRIISDNMDWFIDYENKVCYFDTEEFINLIKDTKDATISEEPHSDPYYLVVPSDTEEAERYFFKMANGTSFQYLLPYKEFNEFTAFIPKANNKGSVYIYPWMRFCITENSVNKELAWEFLKFWTTPEANADATYPFFSVNRQTFKTMISERLEKSILSFEEQRYFLNGDRDRHIHNALDTLDTYNSLPMCYLSPEDFYEIITPEMKKFENGSMSAELTAINLQEKITKALLE